MAKAILTRGGERRLTGGHPWVYQSDVLEVEGSFTPGDVVDLCSIKRKFLGRGYINPQSQIMLRVLTREDEEIDRAFLRRRIAAAWEYRKRAADPDSCRLIYGESDFLPALIVDKFGGYLVVQTLALGMDRMKDAVVDILRELLAPAGIYERNDGRVRLLEGLEQKKGFLSAPFDTMVRMRENGVWFDVDVENGQKTGFFLDQKENRAALRPFVKGGRVLDCFCHTGSFALHAGHYGAREVLGIDISPRATKAAEHNARLNGLESLCRFETANTFDRLREFGAEGTRFDTIILDPPAFTKTKNAVEGAVRGYKEINLQAMKLLEAGGFLVSCSCSQHVDRELFLDILYDAALDAGKKVRLVEYRSQAKDHPILLAAPETEYLKCAVLQIV